MNPFGVTRTSVDLIELAAYTRGVERSHRAYVLDQAEPERPVRYCGCGGELERYRQKCDECRDEAKRVQNRIKQQRHRDARKARS